MTAGLVLRAQHVIDDFVAEVFGVADAGRLFHFLEFGVQSRLVEGHAGGRIHIDLFLNPKIGERHVAVEQFLAIIGIRLQIGGLDLLGEFLEIARDQEVLEMHHAGLLQIRAEVGGTDAFLDDL